jgi:hypothetical protein
VINDPRITLLRIAMIAGQIFPFCPLAEVVA